MKEKRGPPDHVCVERARKAAVAREHHNENPFFRPSIEQRMRFRFHARRRRAQHSQNFARVRPRREDTLLRAPQFRRGDEFHRSRDLLRALHGAYASPVIE